MLEVGKGEGMSTMMEKNPIQQEDSSSKTPDRHMQWGIGQA